MPHSDHILKAHEIHKSLGRGQARVHVLRGLDLSVRRGEFLAVMGPSGCGKSTLLHVLGLMTPPDEGQLHIEGEAVSSSDTARTALRRSAIGFVFQRFNLLSTLCGRDNIDMSLRVRGCREPGRADDLLAELGVADVADRKPGEMSIGQQQRVAVARAMAHRPALLLADEPTGNLDSAASRSLLEIFRTIHAEEHQTIVMITHSAEAARWAERTLHMRDGGIHDRPR